MIKKQFVLSSHINYNCFYKKEMENDYERWIYNWLYFGVRSKSNARRSRGCSGFCKNFGWGLWVPKVSNNNSSTV